MHSTGKQRDAEENTEGGKDNDRIDVAQVARHGEKDRRAAHKNEDCPQAKLKSAAFGYGVHWG